MELRSSKIKNKIKDFFISFLETIVRELETGRYNSELTRRKRQKYSDFIFSHGYEIMSSNEYLGNFHTMYSLEWYDFDKLGHSSYYEMSVTDKEKARGCGSRKKYNKIPMDYKIHDMIDTIETYNIPILVYFFTYRYDLFEELQKNMDSVA